MRFQLLHDLHGSKTRFTPPESVYGGSQCQTQSDILSYCCAILRKHNSHPHSRLMHTVAFSLNICVIFSTASNLHPPEHLTPPRHSHFSVIQQHPVHGADGPVRRLLGLEMNKAVALGALFIAHDLQQTQWKRSVHAHTCTDRHKTHTLVQCCLHFISTVRLPCRIKCFQRQRRCRTGPCCQLSRPCSL